MDETLELLTRLTKELTHLHRARIFLELHYDRPMSASQLAQLLKTSKQNVSYHLGRLLKAGIITASGESTNRFEQKYFVIHPQVVRNLDLYHLNSVVQEASPQTRRAIVVALCDVMALHLSTLGQVYAETELYEFDTHFFGNPASILALLPLDHQATQSVASTLGTLLGEFTRNAVAPNSKVDSLLLVGILPGRYRSGRAEEST